jgi:hypothetical protein
MQMFHVNILNPKAAKLLQDLADMKLISISECNVSEFSNIVEKLRKKAEGHVPDIEEITKEVDAVRSKRHAKRKA